MDRQTLTFLVCPLCKGRLYLQKAQQQLVCKFDRLAYPIENDMPVLLEQKAEALSLEEIEVCQ
jgi:uncharacterized protein